LFAQQGLILMDPLDPELHRVATPLYQPCAGGARCCERKLLQRGKDLDRAGFDAQVKVTSRSTLLFYLGEARGKSSRRQREISGRRQKLGAR